MQKTAKKMEMDMFDSEWEKYMSEITQNQKMYLPWNPSA